MQYVNIPQGLKTNMRSHQRCSLFEKPIFGWRKLNRWFHNVVWQLFWYLPVPHRVFVGEFLQRCGRDELFQAEGVASGRERDKPPRRPDRFCPLSPHGCWSRLVIPLFATWGQKCSTIVFFLPALSSKLPLFGVGRMPCFHVWYCRVVLCRCIFLFCLIFMRWRSSLSVCYWQIVST